MAHPTGRAQIVEGIRYRSQFEAAVARDLLRRGVSFEYEGERVFYAIPHTYVTDFTIPEECSETGQPIYVETKGWFRPEDKRKMLAIKADNPGMDLRLVFQNRPDQKTLNWCRKQQVEWAYKRVPDSWLKEKR